MATIFAILMFLQTNGATIIQVQQSVFFALSSLFQLMKMPKTSKFFGTWAVDGGRLIRWLTNPRRVAAFKSIVTLLPKAKANLTLLVIMLGISGCFGTFEEARVVQSGPLQASPTRVSSDRCVVLSDREWLYGGIAKGGAVLTGATGISALPLEGRYETAVAITTLTVATGTAASFWYSQSAGTKYVMEGCAK